MTNQQTVQAYAIGFTVAAAAAAAGLGYLVLRPFLAAIAWAVVLAAGFHSAWVLLQRRMPRRRGLAAAGLVLGIGLLVLLPAGILAAVLASEAQDAVRTGLARLEDAHLRSLGDLAGQPAVARALRRIQDLAGISPDALQRTAKEALDRAAALAPGLSARLALGAFEALGTFAMTLFLLFFLFRDGAVLARSTLELVPLAEPARADLARSFRTMLQAMFRGTLLCALAQGAAGAFGWWIAGLPMPTLAGAAMGVFSLLPVGGTAFVWLPGTLWAWLDGHRGGAVFLLAWGLLVVSFAADNILRPLLMRNTRQLSPVVVILGVLGGLPAFGALGLFIGPIALALGLTVLDALRVQARPS